jgi:hypothetical protein
MGSPTILIHDDIQTSSLGGPQTAGVGWAGNGIIYAADGGPGDGFTPPVGPYGLQWIRYGAQQVFSPILSVPLTDATLFFSVMCGTGNLLVFTQLAFLIFDPVLSRQIPCFYLNGSADGSLSALTADGQLIFNSGKANEIYLQNLVWYYIQVNVSFSTVSGFINVTCSVAVQGVSVGSGSKLSTIPATSGLGMNQFYFSSGATGGIGLCNMALCHQVPLCLTNPSNYITQPSIGPPNTTPNSVIQQLIMEIGALPTDSNLIVQQLVNELALLPTNTNVVIQQLVIELAISGKFIVGNFPEYIKRKNIGI